MNDGMGSSIFKEWARRYAPGLVETRTTFDLDPALGVPPKMAPIEGVFSRKGAPGLSAPAIQPAKIEGPTTFPTPETAPENPLAGYTPDPNSMLPKPEVTPVEGAKPSGGISPGAMGLLGMGLSMAATPPRAVPYSGAEIIGRSGLAGLGIYEKALEAKRKQQALDVSAEEHRLSREDQKLFRQGLLADKEVQRKIQEENAKSLAGAREASAEAKKGKLVPVKQSDGSVVYERMLDAVGKEVPQKPKSSAWREVNFNGKNQWVDLNSPEAADLAKQGAFGVKDKPGFAYFVGDDGRVTEVQKGAPPGTAPKEVAPPGTGKKAGGPKQFEYQDAQAKASLVQKGIPEPTIEEIAKERQALFPKGATKANARNPRAAIAPTYKVGEQKKYIADATSRKAVLDRLRQMRDAGYTREQIEEAAKGSKWE